MGVESNGEIDKEELYGTFNESYRNNQRFANKAAHKALDLPMDDEMQINTTDNRVVNNYGSKTGTLAKLALGAGLLATGAGAPYVFGLIVDALKDRPAATTPAGPDKDTLFDLELVK